tara:strand:- start:12424 stop:13413 length:990 start_codon:yes stop_codon:yes gene_type:complete
MRYLVTGGAGFIGSNLVEALLKKGHSVRIVDNFSSGSQNNIKNFKKKIKILNHDISKDSNKLSKFFSKVDVVIHLAGIADIVPSIQNPKRYYEVNVTGTLNILQAANKANVKKFLYAASASCYGIPKKYPTKETENLNPQYPYALSKVLGEKLVIHWAKVYQMPNVSLRFFNVYGPRSRTTGAYGAVFGVFLAQKLKKKPLTIVGNGQQTRDFIHVYDLVDALIKISKSNIKQDVFNLGGGKEVSVNTIANIIGGKKIKIPKRPGEPDRSLADISKIKSKINWKPKITMNSGIKMLLREIKNWRSAPVWTPAKIKIATKEWFKYLKIKK